MIKHFVCQIKQFYADCPKSDNWFGCHAVTSKGRKIRLLGKTLFRPMAGMWLSVDVKLHDRLPNGEKCYKLVYALPCLSRDDMQSVFDAIQMKMLTSDVIDKLYGKYGRDTAYMLEKNIKQVQLDFGFTKEQLQELCLCCNNSYSILHDKFPMLPNYVVNHLVDSVTTVSDTITLVKSILRNPYGFRDIYNKSFRRNISLAVIDKLALDVAHVSVVSPFRIRSHMADVLKDMIYGSGANGSCYIDVSTADNTYLYKLNQSLNGTRFRGEQAVCLMNQSVVCPHMDFNTMLAWLQSESASETSVIYLEHYKDMYWHLYTKSAWVAKETLKQNVLSMLDDEANCDAWDADNEIDDVIDQFSNDLFEKHGYRLDAEQEHAIEFCLSNQLSILTGGPGCGKTATVSYICKAWCHVSHQHVLLLAPTGRAAANLRDATGFGVHTIAKLLFMYDLLHGDVDALKKAFSLTDDGLCIIDECSMVGLEDMSRLFQILSEEFRYQIILVGDKNQLQSVNYGSPFVDMIKSGVVPIARLLTCHRSEVAVIVGNADKILSGDTKIMSSDGFYLSDGVDDTDTQIASQVLQSYGNAVSKLGLKKVLILSAFKDGPAGVYALNIALQQKYNPDGMEIPYARYGSKTYHTYLRVGDRVVCTKNQRKSGIVNGDCGTILRFGKRSITVNFDDYGVITMKPESEESVDIPLDLAYVMTVHKAQGCEYPCVIVSIPNYCHGFAPIANRSLLYTAVTRAKECVCIIGNRSCVDSYIYAIPSIRASTLAEELCEESL